MTTLPDRPNTALIVIDAQNGVLGGAIERDVVIERIGSLVERARSEDVPVIWVQHSDQQLVDGSDEWKIVPDLQPADTEPIVHKHHGDAYEDTTLEAELAHRGVGRVVIAGAQSDACIRSTLHGAFVRGYDTVLVADAHTTEDLTEYGMPAPDKVIAHTNMSWSWTSAPGKSAEVVETAAVEFVPSTINPS